jgi:hypothetical protein
MPYIIFYALFIANTQGEIKDLTYAIRNVIFNCFRI